MGIAGEAPGFTEQVRLFPADHVPHGLKLEPAVEATGYLVARDQRDLVRDGGTGLPAASAINCA